MITAGIDCGAKTVKVVILKDGQILGKSLVLAGIDAVEASEKAYAEAMDQAGFKWIDIENVVATGAGKNEVKFKNDTATEVGAGARGGVCLFPAARIVIDVGAEEGRAVRVNEKGKVVDFAINEKCAAGSGAFTEAMARALEVSLEEMGPLSLKATQAVPMNAQCAVFAESELVTLIHAKTPKPDMARAIHDAIADRIVSMVRRVGIESEVVLIGGVAKNVGFVDSLNREHGQEINIPEEPEFVGALGAALIAADQ
ncbi:MAG: CoA activase [Deltaproteobacteria bacterium]|nr:CoA activase [Deltaproteobacteria bacterium]